MIRHILLNALDKTIYPGTHQMGILSVLPFHSDSHRGINKQADR